MVEKGQLKRTFGLTSAVALIVGQVIAVGIFLTPAGMAKSVVSPFWLLVVWLAVAVMTMSGALCFGELAARFPAAGGSYVYLREAYGKGTSFLYGWMVLLVLDPGITAIFGVGASAYLAYIVPMSAMTQKAVAVLMIIVIGAINILGVRIGTEFLRILTAVKLALLVFIIGYGFAAGKGDAAHFTPFFAPPPDIFGAVAGGLVGAFFAYAGWWEVTRISGEIRDPQRNIPRALIAGVTLLTIIYVATSAVFMYLVPSGLVTSDETFAAQAGEALFGGIGGQVFAAIVVVSVLGTLFAYFIASPRVYFAMANDGLFFSAFGRLHRRFGTPHRATLIQMAIAAVLILSGSFNEILSYFFFIVILFVGLTVLGLFRIRKGSFDGYKTPFFPLTPVLFLTITAVVLFFVAMRNPVNTAIGAMVVLAGIPVYYLLFRRDQKDIE